MICWCSRSPRGSASRPASSAAPSPAGLEEWRFLKAVRVGDTIRMKSTVIEARRTTKGDRGVVRLAQEVSNQRDEVVQAGVFASLMARTYGLPEGAST